MANEDTKVLPAMVGGDGPHSYTQNSSYQKGLVDASKEMVIEGIKSKLDFKSLGFDSSKDTFRIADFGCSAGPNTFFAVENIIKAVELKYHAQFDNSPPLAFQVFFNDVTTNDFNTLFKTLHRNNKYFAAGLPGTFYGRLLPSATLHFAYSSYSLHWLSKVPKEVVDSESPAAWNKGSIHCHGLKNEVTKAYSAQFRSDINTFLNARGQEIVGGGLMVIIMSGLPEGILLSQTGIGKYYDLLGSCLIDMAKLGMISEEKVDSFNLPLYYSSSKEIEEIIKENGNFSIERLDSLTHPISQASKKFNNQVSIMGGRAVFQGLLEEHFGSEVVEKTFEHFAKKLADSYSIFDGAAYQHIDYFILLKRNVN